MSLLRVIVGLTIAATGFVAALVMLFIGIASFKAKGSPVAQVGSVLIFALVEGASIFGAIFMRWMMSAALREAFVSTGAFAPGMKAA